jgi:hypothetical protein
MKKLILLFLLYSISTSPLLIPQTPPLSTIGNRIIDSENNLFIFKGVNWWGANGSKYPFKDKHKDDINTHEMPFGLHVQTIEKIANAIKAFGFNTVRLPFSNEMLHNKGRIKKEWVVPNSQLVGMTPLEVLDEVIRILTKNGLFVLLNNHSTTSHWCCDYDYNGLWYGNNKFYSQTSEQWMNDWVMLAKRYRTNQLVIGADLRNEIRPQRGEYFPFPKNPNWGKNNKNDWHKYATLAGNAIHQVNPELLIIVEGINAQIKFPAKLLFPHLKPVMENPIILHTQNKLVYEIHNYSFSLVEANLLQFNNLISYADLTTEQRTEQYENNWGFLLTDDYSSPDPVILGEFGCSGTSKNSEEYLKDLTNYINSNNIGFFWWTLEEDLNDSGSYGIMNATMDEINVQEDWRWNYLKQLFE